MTLNCLIVDDDPLCRGFLKRYCEKTDGVKITDVCLNGKEALDRYTPEIDLIFLDMDMPEMDGLTFLNEIPVSPAVIFTTMDPSYAVEAFNHSAIDFLKKPIRYARFKEAINKAKGILIKEKIPISKPVKDHLFIKEGKQWSRVKYKDILYFENAGDYISIKTIHKKFLIYSTMKALDEQLPPQNFQQVHQSFIVNLEEIINLEEGSLVIGKKVIPISKSRKKPLLQKLNLLK